MTLDNNDLKLFYMIGSSLVHPKSDSQFKFMIIQNNSNLEGIARYCSYHPQKYELINEFQSSVILGMLILYPHDKALIELFSKEFSEICGNYLRHEF